MNDSDDIKTKLAAHLDDALPTADERRTDLARLARVRDRRRFGWPAVAASVVVGALVAGGAHTAPGLVSALAHGDEDGDVKLVVRENGVETVRIVGARDAYVHLLEGAVSSHALPDFVGQRLVRLRSLHASGFDVVADVAHAVPGLVIGASPCVAKRVVDVKMNAIPAQVFVDAFARALSVQERVVDHRLELFCDGEEPTQLFDQATPWPPRDERRDQIVDVDADDAPLADVLASLGRQLHVPVRPGGDQARHVTLTLHRVRLDTVFQALRDQGVHPMLDDDGSIFLFTADLPALKEAERAWAAWGD